MANEDGAFSRHTEFENGIRNGTRNNFSTDYEGMVCTGCGKIIEHGQLAFVLNFGMESRKYPLDKVLRFTGLAWHAGGKYGNNQKPSPHCLKVATLPGCAERDGIEEEFSRAILPCAMTKEAK